MLLNYWYSKDSKKAKTYLIFAVLLIILEVGLSLYLNIWRNDFWSAIEHRKVLDFWGLIGVFTLIAFTLMFVSGYTGYLQSKAALLWREYLLHGLSSHIHDNVDYPEQRIADDSREYSNTGINIVMGAIRCIGAVLAFICVVVGLMPWYFLLVPMITAVLSTVLSKFLGTKIANLNYVSQKLEARFRDYLTTHRKAQTYFTAIETMGMFEPVKHNYLSIFKWNKLLSYFQSGYLQANVIIPYLIIAPLYFAEKLTFGLFMQGAGALNHVADSLGYLVTIRGELARWQSSKKRLEEFN